MASRIDSAMIHELHKQLSQVNVLPLDLSFAADLNVSELRRGRRIQEDQEVGFATLLEREGVFYWQQGLVSGGLPQRRGYGRSPGESESRPVMTVKFEKLGLNKVASKLEDLDQKFTPNPGLRELADGQLKEGQAVPLTHGRILVFIHGTFSNNDKLIADLNDESNMEGRQFLSSLTKQISGKRVNYDQVLTFDHPTLSRNPLLNALELARALQGSTADIDVICHSRGGLVTRWFLEVLDHKQRQRRRAVFVGSPLAGTSLAAPDRVRRGVQLFTNVGITVSRGLSLIPFTQVAGALMQVLFSIPNVAVKTPIVDAAVAMIPGLSAMSRVSNNYELHALKDCSANPPQYFGITSKFRGDHIGWHFWRLFCDFEIRAAELAGGLIFRDELAQSFPNDLVVDTASMTQYGFTPNPIIHEFGEQDHVYHTIYFRQAQTIRFIRDKFGIV